MAVITSFDAALIALTVIVVMLGALAIYDAAREPDPPKHRTTISRLPLDSRHYVETGELRQRPFDWERD